MAYGERLQGSRYEFKYVVDEMLVRPIRDYVLAYLEPDEHALEENGWEYAVHSLYLDSPSLALCRATMQGQKNRFKLRIRFYDFAAHSPVFFEIKRRVSDVILKQRAKIRREAASDLLAGHWPGRSYLCDDNGEDLGALEQFCRLRDMYQADGKVFVSYLREAYVTHHDNSIRVTFDRRICGVSYEGNFHISGLENPVYPKLGGVVLELKFTNRFPNWMRQMVGIFDLERTSVAKYVSCTRTLAGGWIQFGRVPRKVRT